MGFGAGPSLVGEHPPYCNAVAVDSKMLLGDDDCLLCFEILNLWFLSPIPAA